MKEIIFVLVIAAGVAKLSVLYLEKSATNNKEICVEGKPRVYFEYKGKWATAELLRMGETCYE